MKIGSDPEGRTGQLSAKSVSAVASGGLVTSANAQEDSSEHSSQKDFRGQSPIKTAEKGRGRRSPNSCSSKRSAPKINSSLSRSHEERAPKILKVLVSDSQAVRKGLSSATTVLSLAPPLLSPALLAPRPESLGLAYSVQYFRVLRLQTLESMALKVSVLVF
ncbi:otoancorin [Platysternon megacephalum]|uniref:Otoancorin n=1 Tax=Platysternon megacephalum TaxID=55544 RepID=A0A4D9E8I4_9SAUR|nr:otoancorin [Platysternon megacephalum]